MRCRAPIQEKALLNPLLPLLVAADDDGHDDGAFHGPSLTEFFPPAIFFEGTPFELNRIRIDAGDGADALAEKLSAAGV